MEKRKPDDVSDILFNAAANRRMTSHVMSELARKGHEKRPRGKKFYRDMARKRWAGNLSTGAGKDACGK